MTKPYALRLAPQAIGAAGDAKTDVNRDIVH